MRTLAALDLRKIRLAELLPRLGLNSLHQLLLGERTIQAAEGTFDLAQVTDFFSQRHICQIAIILSQYGILSRTESRLFTGAYAISTGLAPSVRRKSLCQSGGLKERCNWN